MGINAAVNMQLMILPSIQEGVEIKKSLALPTDLLNTGCRRIKLGQVFLVVKTLVPITFLSEKFFALADCL